MERLQKVIAKSGITSRRKAEELIKKGKVLVNGIIVKELGTKVSDSDEVVVEGQKLIKEEKEYYLLNKPRGVVSTVSDDLGRKNVCDLINTTARIYPVGRLDYDTTGLLILTNDGELANKLMHPKFNCEKTYVVKIEGLLTMDFYHKLKAGIMIDKIKLVPKRLKIRKKDFTKNTTIVEISITEGRNHIIKNVFENLGFHVLKLKRTKYGFLDLGSLNSGEYRKLSVKEIKRLFNETN